MKKIEYLEMMNDLWDDVAEKSCKACETAHYEAGSYCLACEADIYDHLENTLTDDDIDRFFYLHSENH